jgi:hypothetical protein
MEMPRNEGRQPLRPNVSETGRMPLVQEGPYCEPFANTVTMTWKLPSVCLSGLLVLSACRQTPSTPSVTGADLAAAWADMTLHLTQHTPSNSPTYASRCLGYIGLTMYESAVHADSGWQSLAGQLNGLDSLPTPSPGLTYDWRLSLNAGQAAILRAVYQQTSAENLARIDSLEQVLADRLHRDNPSGTDRTASVRFGKTVADRIFEWSKTDGGHRGYLHNFDKAWVHPERPGAWQPPLFAQSFSHHPLHPHWGDNRPFLPANTDLAPPMMIPYDTMPGSPYYEQFHAVYQQERTLTQEQKEIAIWWGDDPDVSFTPPGHSYHIARLAVLDWQPDLVTAAATFARVGMAVADAFINCWKWKYQFFTERPNTFITRHIDPTWESFWPDPPFPAFPSGHAIQAAAAAAVLTDLYGPAFVFTDSVHLGRERDEVRQVDFHERSFTTFGDVARETADSRFYGGIHIPHDNAVGLEKGSLIGRQVNELAWRRPASVTGK